MPTFEPRSFAAAALTCGLLLAGCSNEAGSDRAEAETTLADLSAQLELAATTAIVDGDTTGDLSRIASAAGNVGGTDAQKQAGQRLAAAARSQLAEIEFARGVAATAASARARAAAESQVRAAARISDLADLLADADDTDARRLVEATIAAAESAVDAAANAVADLDGPIADLRSLNDADLQQAGRLNGEANTLRAEARAVGYADGLPSYRRAIELEQEANGFEFRVAARQNELDNQLEPESRLQQTEIEGTRAAIEQLRTSLTAMGDRERQMSDAVTAMRTAVGNLRTSIERAMGEADPASADAFFEAAIGHAQSAAQAAGRSGRRGADGRVRAQLMHARILAARASEMRSHAASIRAAAGVSGLGMGDSAADSLEQSADAAATEAQSLLAEVIAAAAGSEALAPLGRTAERTRAALGGDA